MNSSDIWACLRPKRKQAKTKKSKKRKSKSFTDKVTGEKRVILQGKDYTGLRWQKYQAVGGKCERCGHSAPFYNDPEFCGGHLHHKNGRGAGKRQDTLEATEWLCFRCHWGEHNPKVVPSKREFECREGKA